MLTYSRPSLPTCLAGSGVLVSHNGTIKLAFLPRSDIKGAFIVRVTLRKGALFDTYFYMQRRPSICLLRGNALRDSSSATIYGRLCIGPKPRSISQRKSFESGGYGKRSRVNGPQSMIVRNEWDVRFTIFVGSGAVNEQLRGAPYLEDYRAPGVQCKGR